MKNLFILILIFANNFIANAQEIASLHISPSGEVKVVAKKEPKIDTVSFSDIVEKRMKGTFYTSMYKNKISLVTTIWEPNNPNSIIVIETKGKGEYDNFGDQYFSQK